LECCGDTHPVYYKKKYISVKFELWVECDDTTGDDYTETNLCTECKLFILKSPEIIFYGKK
jgi:hypothetical protein